VLESAITIVEMDKPYFYSSFVRRQLEPYEKPRVGEHIPRPYRLHRPEK